MLEIVIENARMSLSNLSALGSSSEGFCVTFVNSLSSVIIALDASFVFVGGALFA